MAHRHFASSGFWLVLILAGFAAAPAALGQNTEKRQLMNRLERIQNELSTLQRTVYRGGKPPAAAAGASQTPAGLDRRIIARVEVRLTQLENELRRMTGKAEELEHAIGRFNARLDKLISDVDVRLSALERGQPGGFSTPAPGALPEPPSASAPPSAPDAPPSNLGSITPKELATQRQEPPAVKPALPDGTPVEQYEYATSLLLADQNIEEADRALRAFIQIHPKHKLASNAHYWLGETHYVRKDFQQAAFAFADGFQKFPKSRKAADNLLKLGMSLGQLGKKKEACTAFSRLLSNFPKAGRTLTGRVTREKRRFKCR